MYLHEPTPLGLIFVATVVKERSILPDGARPSAVQVPPVLQLLYLTTRYKNLIFYKRHCTLKVLTNTYVTLPLNSEFRENEKNSN